MKVEAIGGFDWDETNVGKLAVHGLKPNDVEDFFDFCEPVVFQHPKHRERWLALGVLADERFILVSFELDEETRWARVVTAFEPTGEKWWKSYAKSKGIKAQKK